MLSKIITATLFSLGLGMTASAHSQTSTPNCCELNLPCCEQGQTCCITTSRADCCENALSCCEQAEQCCLSEKARFENQPAECETGGNCCLENSTANSPPQ